MNKKYCIITTACDNKDIADMIVKTLLEMKLVAYCQVSKIR